MRARALPLFLLILIPALAPVLAADKSVPGTLEVVAQLPINSGNLAVTADGRVCATVHQFMRVRTAADGITGR